MNYEQERKRLLSARTPDQYIDYSYRSQIKGAAKSVITREWLESTGYQAEDISYARNRHPHWKALKGKGGYERTQDRISKHNYARNGKKVEWNKENLSEFYDLNKKGMLDFELAQHFKTTLPAINHVRRKIKISERILLARKEKIQKTKILKEMIRSEPVLRRVLDSLGG